MAIITGTNTPTTRSTVAWIGNFSACAFSTMRTIRAKTVSVPVARTSIQNVPSALIVPPMTSSPISLATGTGSPVNIDSSTSELPSMTTPSTATRSPGRMRKTSPTPMVEMGTVRSSPSTIWFAVSGRNFINASIAAPVLPLARASK